MLVVVLVEEDWLSDVVEELAVSVVVLLVMLVTCVQEKHARLKSRPGWFFLALSRMFTIVLPY